MGEQGTGTQIVVAVRNGRHVVRTRSGALRGQRLHGPPDRARVALVGQTALLLGGDAVEVDIEVGAGARLELVDVAATVAYHGRGRPATWRTRIRLGSGAGLLYAGQPLVVGDGADVVRSLEVDCAEGASAYLRESVVYGRSGEAGGRLDVTTSLRRAGTEFCRERLRSDASARSRPGLLTGLRVVDSVFALGLPAPLVAAHPQVECFQLLEPGCTLTRFLGTGLADSPL